MYMIAFVTLVVALIGAYAQAWSLQARNLYQNQTAISDAMVAWHQAAVSIAGTFSTPPSVPCSLTYPAPTTMTTSCGTTVASNHLPLGHQTSSYTFYSTAFKTTTPAHYYVLTYIPKAAMPEVGVDLLCLPGGLACKRLPISFSGFAAQVAKNPKISPYAFGTVYKNTLACGSVAQPCLATAPVPLLLENGATAVPKSIVYPLPSVIPENAIGIITELP